MSGSLPVGGHSSPVVRPGDVLLHAGVDHGFNCEDMSWFHEAWGFVVGVVGDVGCAMEQSTDSMPSICAID